MPMNIVKFMIDKYGSNLVRLSFRCVLPMVSLERHSSHQRMDNISVLGKCTDEVHIGEVSASKEYFSFSWVDVSKFDLATEGVSRFSFRFWFPQVIAQLAQEQKKKRMNFEGKSKWVKGKTDHNLFNVACQGQRVFDLVHLFVPWVGDHRERRQK